MKFKTLSLPVLLKNLTVISAVTDKMHDAFLQYAIVWLTPKTCPYFTRYRAKFGCYFHRGGYVSSVTVCLFVNTGLLKNYQSNHYEIL